MKTLIIILSVLFTNVLNASKVDTRNLTLDYLEIKNALVESNSEEANRVANNILSNIGNLLKLNEYQEIYDAIFKIANTKEIEKQRKSFAILSVELWSLIKSDAQVGMTLYYHYCPMKKYYWISEIDTIKNPYYGKQMLSCGVSKESNKN